MYPAAARRYTRYRSRDRLVPRAMAAVVMIAAVAAVAACSVVFGGDEPPAAGQAPPALLPVERDVKLALKARQVFQQDEDLRDLNLGVRVQGGVAILWGPVPSAELERKAVRLLRTVGGVREVRSEAYLAADKKVEPIRVPTEVTPPTQTQSASVGAAGTAADPRGQLTGRTPVIALPPSGRSGTAPPPAAPVTLGPPVTLLAPVLTPAPPTATNPPPAADSLSAAVQRLRQSDNRFRQVRVEIEGSAVFVGGGDVPAEHVMALARAISGLQGVERVVIRSGPGPR
jgi:hypothetical protein